MPAVIPMAAVTPDNTPAGYNLTFLFPMILFLVAGVILYMLLFARPHARVPARRSQLPGRAGAAGPGAAHAAAVAGGLSVAPGGGAAESHAEAAGAVRHAEATGTGRPQGADPGPGIVSGQDGGPGAAGPDDAGETTRESAEADE